MSQKSERRFECDECGKTFRAKAQLTCHVKIHKIDQDFKCADCDLTFITKSHLKRHVLVHTGEKPFKCDVCNGFFRDKHHHKEIHIGRKPFPCPKCDSSFIWRPSLSRHMKRMHSEIVALDGIHQSQYKRTIMCGVCQKTCATQNFLKIHMRQHINDEQGTISLDLETVGKQFACTHCDVRFDRKWGMHRHIAEVHMARVRIKQHKCDQCSATFFNNSRLKQHAIVHSIYKRTSDNVRHERHQCSQCELSYASKHSLKNHVAEIHDNIRPHKCLYCELSFVTTTKLKHHAVVHSNELSFKCPHCIRYFKLKQSLRKHIRLHHNSVVCQFKCNKCDNSFTTSTGLKLHEINHTRELKLKCDLCPSTFLFQNNLIRHVNSSHNGEQQLSHSSVLFKCYICSFNFGRKDSLERHIICAHNSSIAESDSVRCQLPKRLINKLTMDSFNCRKCNFTGKAKEDLENHRQSHTHKKLCLFDCNECDKSFSKLFYFHQHKIIHEKLVSMNEKKFACELCDKTFENSNDLKIHLDLHEQKDSDYKCSQCDLSFKCQFSLLIHNGSIHEEKSIAASEPSVFKHKKKERKFKCNQCTAAFLFPHNLTKHIASHIVEKKMYHSFMQFTCNICSTIFSRKDSLKKHIICTHSDNSEKLDRFRIRLTKNSIARLKMEMKSFNCRKCNFSAATKNDLEEHRLLETHKKLCPFDCTECDLSFSKLYYFLQHKIVHAKIDSLKKNKVLKKPVCKNKFFTKESKIFSQDINQEKEIFHQEKESFNQDVNQEKKSFNQDVNQEKKSFNQDVNQEKEIFDQDIRQEKEIFNQYINQEAEIFDQDNKQEKETEIFNEDINQEAEIFDQDKEVEILNQDIKQEKDMFNQDKEICDQDIKKEKEILYGHVTLTDPLRLNSNVNSLYFDHMNIKLDDDPLYLVNQENLVLNYSDALKLEPSDEIGNSSVLTFEDEPIE